MSKSLDDALGDGAWSVSAVMSDLNDKLDDEGRPISERRADANVRADVEMEMRKCPFSGTRNDKWMNVSALGQVNRYFSIALEEFGALRNQVADDNASWDDIFAVVIDQLAGPAIFLLQQRAAQGLVPAKVAVGHKLAAGYFGVLRDLHERLALGADIPVTVDAFLKLVDETDALVGTTEVCAGSDKMILKASVALIERSAANHLKLDPSRIERARYLALQVKIGIFWHLYDQLHLWSLIKGDYREYLKPTNTFVERKLVDAGSNLALNAPAKADSAVLPEALDSGVRSMLANALDDAADASVLQEDEQAAMALLNEPGSAIEFNGDYTRFTHSVASYLHTYRQFEAVLSGLELKLRENLGFPSDIPIRLGPAVFPVAQALPWYELILGRRLGPDGRLSGNKMKARVAK